MLFTSYGFIIFIFLVISVYYILPAKIKWVWLLLAGYTFYFFANPVYPVYIFATTVCVWTASLLIYRRNISLKQNLKDNSSLLTAEEKSILKSDIKKANKRILLVGLIISLGILFVVKYADFAIGNVNMLMGMFGIKKTFRLMNIIVPMGISFYTFKAVSYLVDVYRGTILPENNIFKFALYVSFFPQLVQGPISRYGVLGKSLFEEHSFDKNNLLRGLERILWGYFKKLVIADRILPAVLVITRNPDRFGGIYVLIGMLFYAVEIYADFTGGIDIAIGISEALGIKSEENFVRPFFSKSVKEYWNRWHITMGSWFTDYVFYPVSVSAPMRKISVFARKHFGVSLGKRIPVYLSALIVWFLTGLWHGASWNFIAWGIGNFLIIMISREFEPLYKRFSKRFPNLKNSNGYKAFQVCRTILIMSLLRTFDCYESVGLTVSMWKDMLVNFSFNSVLNGSFAELGLKPVDYIIVLAGILIILIVSLIHRKKNVRDYIFETPCVVRFSIWFLLFLTVLLFGTYGIGYDANQFIYNRF